MTRSFIKPSVEQLAEFVRHCRVVMAELNRGNASSEEAALEISSKGISLGIFDYGPPEYKRIVKIALDLEVPTEVSKIDREKCWQDLGVAINSLCRHN